MHKDWPEMANELNGIIKDVRLGTPEVMKAFSAMAQAATAGGAIDAKTKELIAIAIAVAIRCDGCVAFHAKAAVKLGATREEIMEAMGMALYMGAGPSLMYAAQAVEAFDQFSAAAAGA
jgi:AhpD family alkylhydroperoxidase